MAKQQNSHDILTNGLRDFDDLPEPKAEATYFDKPGRVIVAITEVKVGKTSVGRITRYVVVGFKVTEVNEGDYKVGDEYITWLNLEDTYSQRDLRSLAAAVAHLSQAEITMAKVVMMLSQSTEDCRDAAGDITGEHIEIVLQSKTSEKSGKTFINPRFYATDVDAPF